MTLSERRRSPEQEGPKGDVAIIGMACIFPKAFNLDAYWQNIVSGEDAISDVPPGRWDPEVFFDQQAADHAKLYCKRGGYLDNLPSFNPLDWGVMPVVIDGGEAEQFLSLHVAQEALADAGYLQRPFNRERTQVVLGRGNYLSRGHVNLLMYTLGIEQTLQVLRSLDPESSEEELEAIRQELRASLPHFGPETAGSLIPNFTTGRVANRLDLMGTNFTVDAACASALIATDIAVRDLLNRRCDLALVGGVHLASHVPFLTVFCQIGALSPRSQIRPFDENADGTLPGEGVGIVVLKRREDAERDGDRIYALIKGVGTSSDGRGQGLLAPREEGEELALRRAYAMANLSPETIGLIEAHGTATPAGDVAEIRALSRVFGGRTGVLPTCALGTVKSMIGHTMAAAGIAGLIKAALALYHKVLPPTLHCQTPDPKLELEKTPFYINTETRPWIHGAADTPRRAGVNAFGFGGINAHVVLEEHPSSSEGRGPSQPLHWETEVCLMQAASRQDLMEQVRRLERYLDSDPPVHLKDVAYTLNAELPEGCLRLALVASSLGDLRQKLSQARARLADPACRRIKDVSGIYFFEEPLRPKGKVVFLFPGEASQYSNMLKDLALHFPEVRAAFDTTEGLFIRQGRPLLPSQCIFPIPGLSEAERLETERRLWEMGGALEGILTANLALYTLLSRLEIQPDIVLGHSSGEFSALVASGILESDSSLLERLLPLSAAYERLAAEGEVPQAALAAVGTDRASIKTLLDGMGEGLYVSMDNCPHQVVIAGSEEAMEDAIQRLRARGIVCQRLPFNRAYHTPLFAAAAQPLRAFLQTLPISSPEIEVYSCATMAPYPRSPQEIRELVVETWTRPAEFRGTIEALYEHGSRIFIEVGPRGNLTAFVEDILRGRPHLAIACDTPWRSGITQLNHLVGLLHAHGVKMRLDCLYEQRKPQRLSLEELTTADDGTAKHGLSVALSLDLPMIRLSRERASSLVSRPSALAEQAAIAGREGQWLPRSEPATPMRSRTQDNRADALPAPQRGGPVYSPMDIASQVMQEHLHTMERFLAVEQEVMEAFLGGAEGLSAEETAETQPSANELPAVSVAAPHFPFIGTVISFSPEGVVVLRRRIDPDEDLFVRDHCFGTHQVSDVDETLRPLPILPFTICMEIMAEAAALLMPGRLLTAMRQLEIRQWVEVDTPVTLEVTARRSSESEIEVQISNLGDAADAAASTPVAGGTVVFGDAYGQPPPFEPLVLKGEQPCPHTAAQMYQERLMFHGPRFQGVDSLDKWGENGIVGHLRVLSPADLFRSTVAPHFLIDPLLLDAAGQLLGYWAGQRLDAGYVVFPFRLSALKIYGSNVPAGERMRCEVNIDELTPRQIRVTMNLLGPDGRLLLRLEGWEDWRFFWPRELFDFLRFPREHLLGTAWDTPMRRFPAGETFACQRLVFTEETSRDIILHTLSYTILSWAERQQWGNLRGPQARRAEWLFGRAAAKDAVRWLLKQRYEVDIRPADVEIGQDQQGRPFANVFGLGESAIIPSLSVTHSQGVAVALAAYCAEGQRLGIDIQSIRPRQEGFQEIAFREDELALLHSLPDSQRDEWVMRLWCAKEAVGKALGTGLAMGLRSLAVRSLDTSTGTVEVILGEELAEDFSELSGAAIVVYTAREEEWVVASTIGERR